MSALPSGVWIAATRLLGRLVPADEEYPHICGFGKVWRRDCAACANEQVRIRPAAVGY